MRDSNRKPKVRIIIIFMLLYVFFFWGFSVFFISSQHSEGVICEMTMRGKMNEGDEGFGEMPLGSDM
jgi:hypothetical protein